MDYRAVLIEFYQKHNPEKVGEVDLLLRKYKGREVELIHALKVKYGVKDMDETNVPKNEPIRQEPVKEEKTEPIRQEVKPEPEPPRQEEETEVIEQKPRESSAQLSSPPPTAGASSPKREDLKGKTAEERADYWRKEVEKREREKKERQSAAAERINVMKGKEEPKTTSGKTMNEKKQIPPLPPKPGKGSVAKTAVLATLILFILFGIGFVLFNKNIRETIATKLGINKSESIAEDANKKKEAIDPGIMKGEENSGNFSLDDEEDEEDFRRAPIVEDLDEEIVPQTKTDDKTQTSTTTTSNKTNEVATTGTLPRNTWYLSYSAVSLEDAAQAAANELKDLGYSKAGYYYIPDYVRNGPKLYKVYIGPYSTIEEAEKVRDEVRSLSKDAYAYLLK